MCHSETYSRVRVGLFLSNAFPNHCGLKQGDALSPLLFNVALEYATRRVQENRVGLELNGKHQLLVYTDDVSMLAENLQTTRENTEIFIKGRKDIGLEVNSDKTKYIFTYRQHHFCGLGVTSLLFKFALEYAIRRVQENRIGLEMGNISFLFVLMTLIC